MYPQVIKGNGDNKRDKYAGGIDVTIGDGSFAREFITTAMSVEEAIGRTVFIDERQLNRVVKLYSRLVRYQIVSGLKTLLLWLNGRPAIGGYNRAQALMSDSKIIAAEALGVKLGKDSMKFIHEQVKAKAMVTKASNEVEGGGGSG